MDEHMLRLNHMAADCQSLCSDCANKLKGGQSAWLGSLMLVNNVLIIRDKRNKPAQLDSVTYNNGGKWI